MAASARANRCGRIINGHSVPEIKYGDGWHVFDASLITYFPRRPMRRFAIRGRRSMRRQRTPAVVEKWQEDGSSRGVRCTLRARVTRIIHTPTLTRSASEGVRMDSTSSRATV